MYTYIYYKTCTHTYTHCGCLCYCFVIQVLDGRAVQAKYTWALSGTPIQNHVAELFSYFRFLQYHPFNTQAFFQSYMRNVEEASNPEHALERLREMVKPVMLRRTKESIFDGRPVLVLPSK